VEMAAFSVVVHQTVSVAELNGLGYFIHGCLRF
jgi:hypothetical protein